MADLIEIVVEADVSSLRDAERALERFEKSSNKLGRTVLDVANKMRRVSSGWDEANKLYRQGVINSRALGAAQVELARELAVLNNYVDANGRLNTRRALSELRAAEAARNAARANAEAAESARRLAQRQQELRMRFQEGYAQFVQARQALRDLREAYRSGIITLEQYRQQVQNLRTQQQAANAAAGDLARRMNRTGVITQQAGYQIGDFIVQVQSGTNFLVAFGQQATQVAGTLTLLGGKWILIGSVLGVAIPLITAVGAAFMRASGEGKTLDQTVQDLETSFGNLDSSLNILKDEQLDQTFGSMADSIRGLTESMVELNQAAALTNLVSTLDTLESSANAGFLRQMGEGFVNIGRVISPFAQGEGLFGMKSVGEVNEEAFEKLGFDMAREQYLAYLDEMQRLASAADIEGVTALIDRFIADAIDNGAELSVLGIQTAQSFSRVALSAAETAAELNGSAQAARDAAEQAERDAEARRREAELLGAAEERRIKNMRLHVELAERDAALIQERNEGVQRILKAVEAETQSLRDRQVLTAAEAQFGRESVEFRTLQATIEERIYRQQLSQNGILGNNQERMVALRQSALRLEERLASSAKAAQELASALQSANTFSSGLDQNVATLEARLAEAKGQQGAVLALTIQQMEAEAELNAMRARAAGEDEFVVRNRLAIDRAQIERFKELNEELEKYGNRSRTSGRKAEDALTDAEKAALDYAKSLDNQVIGAIDGISNAWGDFVVRGFQDFKGFAQAVINSFKNMLAQMIAMAAKNRIMLSLGIGGVGAGVATSAAGSIGGTAAGSLLSGGGMLAGTGVGTALSGLSSGFMTSVYGGLSGTMGAISGGLSVGGIGGVATAIGAAIPPLLAVAAVFSFFKGKTKELDSGLRVAVKSMDTYAETFSTTQTSRFFGLSKRTRTSTSALGADNPVSAMIASIQGSIFETAQYLGIATDSLNSFTYDFTLSLKGLSEEAKMQKITEEVNKLGDSFAALLPNISSMQELQAVFEQRVGLEVRLLQVLGDTQALRERELAATHEYNRELLQQIFAAEDAQEAAQAADRVMQDLNATLRALSENDFATMLDFRRAQASIRAGLPVTSTSISAPAMPTSVSGPVSSPVAGMSGEVAQLRSDMREMHKEVMFAYSKLIKNSKDSRDTLRGWDIVGIPPERTA